MMGATDSRVSGNPPWNLSEHIINKSDVNFFVKLVHVDRYNEIKKSINAAKNKSSSLSTNRNRNDNKIKMNAN